MLSFISASRSLKMPTSLPLSTTITQPIVSSTIFLSTWPTGVSGGTVEGDLGQSRSMRSRSRSASTSRSPARGGSLGERFAALVALVGAFDVLGFAVGTDDHATSCSIRQLARCRRSGRACSGRPRRAR